MTKEDIMRKYIANIPSKICPFASSVANKAILKEVEQLNFESVNQIITTIDWSIDPVLIVFSENISEDVDYLAKELQEKYPSLEVFGSHPNHKMKTRRDPFPNIQVNTIKALNEARKLLKPL